MKSLCLFREDVNSPIFESEFDYYSGTIKNVPEDKFQINLDSYFIDRYEVPRDMLTPFDRSYYVMALKYTDGLFATRFYDIGVTVVSKDSISILLLKDLSITEYPDKKPKGNIFNYKKFPIGRYKTVVNQLDVRNPIYFLTVDEEGTFLTNNGVVSSGITTSRTHEELLNLQGFVKTVREGFDGILLDNSGTLKKFIVSDCNIDLFN